MLLEPLVELTGGLVFAVASLDAPPLAVVDPPVMVLAVVTVATEVVNATMVVTFPTDAVVVVVIVPAVVVEGTVVIVVVVGGGSVVVGNVVVVSGAVVGTKVVIGRVDVVVGTAVVGTVVLVVVVQHVVYSVSRFAAPVGQIAAPPWQSRVRSMVRATLQSHVVQEVHVDQPSEAVITCNCKNKCYSTCDDRDRLLSSCICWH